jgi:hypothetical protein
MRYLQHLLLALSFVSTISATESPADQPPASETSRAAAKQPLYANPQEAFRDLLNALPESSLRAALNSLADFRPGIFESDRRGVERVHDENPPLATKLIVAAVHDLNKRQGGPSNATVTPSPPPNSQSPTPSPSKQPEESKQPESSRPPAVDIPVTVTQTDEEGKTTVVSSHILSEPTASAVVTETLTDDDGSTFLTTATKPAVVVETTDSAGSVRKTTSAVNFAPTPGQKITTTNDQGSTFITTYTPGGGRVSSIKLITTTGEDGQQSVVTSYTYVDPVQTGSGGEQQPGGGGQPGLQNAAAKVGGTVGVALTLLISFVGGVVLMLDG